SRLRSSAARFGSEARRLMRGRVALFSSCCSFARAAARRARVAHFPGAIVRSTMERPGYAFRWRPKHPCGADDLVRIIREPGLLVVVMAGAGEDGFSVCWAPGSRLALDLFADAWTGTSGKPASRLEIAIETVRERFVADARGLQKYVPEDDMGGPHATVTALA